MRSHKSIIEKSLVSPPSVNIKLGLVEKQQSAEILYGSEVKRRSLSSHLAEDPEEDTLLSEGSITKKKTSPMV
jgi:hypothetical protein